MPEEWEVSPLLSSSVAQHGVADSAGNVNIDPNVLGTGTSIDPRIADFIQYGVLNGTFSRGPFDSTANIDPINNPLPDWYGPVQVSGGAIQCSWVADASSPSGYNLRFVVNPGAASDEAYVEQIVPFAGSRKRWGAMIARLAGNVVAVTGPGGGFTTPFSIALLGVSGSVLVTYSTSGVVTDGLLGAIVGMTASASSTAAFVRIRVGVLRAAAAASDTATVDISDVRIDRGMTRVVISDEADPATYAPAYILQTSGILQIVAANGTPPSLSLYSATDTVALEGIVDVQTGQVKFPAADNPSADPNTLDDYQELNGNLGLTFGGGNTGMTLGAVPYRSVKIGSRVYLSFSFTLTAKGSSTGAAVLTGLPYTGVNSAATGGGCLQTYTNMATLTNGCVLRVINNTTTVAMSQPGATATASLTHANFTDTSTFNGSLFYEVA
jgi:hypothetical protein